MSSNSDADLTLPSVVAALSGNNRNRCLTLTIIFHPDTTRIGETAQVPDLESAPPWVLGRFSPSFSRTGAESTGPLQELHVSRQALKLESDGQGLILRRPSDSSRCRVRGRELHGDVALSHEQLREGVPLLLGHSVVLLLRLAALTEPAAAAVTISELRGDSAYMRNLREQIARVGSSGLDVLVRGETGTGKELVAIAIHRASERHLAPMVSVNMAAIPTGLAAATLFGSARGAYTGATRASVGFFGQAQGGSLFLDEIGDTPAEVQPQLLRALQQREIQAVGAAVHKVDVRVISATDAPLESEACDFKAALRHRLGASEIHLLPLREHPEDIGELLQYFLSLSCRQQGCSELLPQADSPAREIAAWAELFHSFAMYRWPGNVRELANFASQVVVADCGALTVPDNIHRALQQPSGETSATIIDILRPPRRNIRDVDEQEFDRALQANAYEVANAARQLGVSRQSVYRRMDVSPKHRLAGQVPLSELTEALAVRNGNVTAVALDLKVSLSSLRSRLRDSDLLWF